MRRLWLSTLLLPLAIPLGPLAAQGPTAVAPSCTADWGCSQVVIPLGFYVETVDEGGRFVTLEDGSVWEIQLDQRAAVAGWRQDDFVRVERIWAPVGDYAWQLTLSDNSEWRAAARLVGRRSAAFREQGGFTPPSERQE